MHPTHDLWIRDPTTGDGECQRCGSCTDCDPWKVFEAPCTQAEEA